MKVDDLKKILADKPGNMEVFFTQTNDEYAYSLLETVEVRNISFSIELPSGGVETAKEECLVLSDEI